MRYVGTTLAALIFGALGVLVATDPKGIGSRYDESVARWWAAGPTRQSLRPRFTADTSRRYLEFGGATLIGLAVLLLVGEIFYT